MSSSFFTYVLFFIFMGFSFSGHAQTDQTNQNEQSVPYPDITSQADIIISSENFNKIKQNQFLSLENWDTLAFDNLPQLQNSSHLELETDLLHMTEEIQSKWNKARQMNSPFFIWVNIPSSVLRVYDTQTGEQLLETPVIVGHPKTPTPIFDTQIVNLKFNPDWSPPYSLQKKGKTYVPAGPNNPLGRIRFSTNNQMNIYLHDTNHHSLYQKTNRALSAGCIRVQKWQDLADLLLSEQQTTSLSYLSDYKTRYIRIPTNLVWISYYRIDFDQNHQLNIYPDIYHLKPFN